jgi:hypothetical protein
MFGIGALAAVGDDFPHATSAAVTEIIISRRTIAPSQITDEDNHRATEKPWRDSVHAKVTHGICYSSTPIVAK